MEGVRRLANDRGGCDRAAEEYFDQVAALVTENGDAVNVQLTCTSLFLTALAFGTVDVPNETQVELIRGLSWLMGVIGDQVDGSDGPALDENGTEAASSSADEVQTLVEYVDSILRQRPGLIGPNRVTDDAVAWLVNVGSATVKVSAIEPADAVALLRFQSVLLEGIAPSGALLETLNGINRADAMHKVYLTDDAVMLEYDQVVDHLTGTRLIASINSFMASADQYDTILQDRFGGATQASDVKAQFSV